MTTPIIPSSVAVRFNQTIQKNLDTRLFLFCNYEPTSLTVVSEEGQFIIAVQDMYKFAIDTSCVLSKYASYIPSIDRPYYTRLSEILELISELRTTIDHNRSINNGWLDQNTLDFCKRWLSSIINKEVIESQEDYRILNEELTRIAGELISLVDRFVNQFANRLDKERVVEKWINDTLSWYTRTTKTDLYRAQLIHAYIAKAEGCGVPVKDDSRRNMIESISSWIDQLIYYPLDAKQQQIKKDIEGLEKALSPDNPLRKKLFHGLKEAKINEVEENLRKQLEEKRKDLSEVQREIREKDSIIRFPESYFFAQLLNDQLRETMRVLELQNIPYTLLPQSLLQEDIERVFSPIPITS